MEITKKHAKLFLDSWKNLYLRIVPLSLVVNEKLF